jgi:hypothetical protein
MIVTGIDPHEASVTAAALSPTNDTLGHRRLATLAKTANHLIASAEEWPERLWAVEGAAGLGHGVAQQLVAAGGGSSTCPPSSRLELVSSAPAAPARPT